MNQTELLHPVIRQDREEMFRLGRKMFLIPELGYKEYKTRDLILAWLEEHHFDRVERYGETGIIVTIGEGSPHIGLLAELDAIPTPGHPDADPETGAAHTCGHSTQGTIMLEALKVLREEMKDRKGTVKLYFCPAEEFTDIAFRKEYIASGKAKYFSGKINMLMDGIFDDSDLLIHLHAMGQYEGHRFSVNSTLAGFTYKQITFHGTASHAAVNPEKGNNALNMFALFQSAVGMLRETFVDEDKNRIHGIVVKGGSTVNSIPDEVIYECYVRSFNQKNLLDLSAKVENAAVHCAAALGGTASFENLPGDLPFFQNRELSEVIYRSMLKFTTPDQILTTERSVAAGDIGDVGCFFPTVQFGYTGFSGYCHGRTMCVADNDEVYAVPCDIVVTSVLDLLDHPGQAESIKNNFRPSMTKEDYLKHLEGGQSQ
ncbi:MAG: amidohydrolase [Solobacterium sp.]|nr:amidohydrolase [Solobacterium sp.]